MSQNSAVGNKVVDLTGDVTGNTLTISVDKIRGKTLDSDLASIGAGEDGHALVWVNGSSEWQSAEVEKQDIVVSPAFTASTEVDPDAGYNLYLAEVPGTKTLFTLTLPPNPSTGDTYALKDNNGIIAISYLVIDGNGKNIEGSSTFGGAVFSS